MAMDNLQISTLCATARAAAPQYFHSYSSKEKVNMPISTGLKKPMLAFSPSPSTFAPSFTTSIQKPRVVCKAKAIDEVLAVTDSSWDELVIGKESTVLVEFWAPWCGPCRMIKPVIEELAKEYAGKIACYTVNTDECPKIASQYGIRSIPTVLFFKDGQKKESVIGAVPKTTLSATIDKYLDL